MKIELLESPRKKIALLGNEAIARGVLEAGIGVATAYPGTPSSEVPMVLSSVAKKLGFYFEYSTNEKVAFETAAGAAWSGVRALVSMKHFGLNVASDSIIPVAYTGVRAGLVVFVADDPEAWSSVQSEQDTRYYARMIRMPMIEPTNPQECLDYTKEAFKLSEEFEIPVFLRTTTKVSHSIGTVNLGKIKKFKTRGKFKKNPKIYYNFRPNLQVLHDKLNKKIEQIEKKYGQKFNKIFPGKGKIGIVTSGVSFEYVKEAIKELGINPPIAKIGLSHPLSKMFLEKFIRDKKTVLIVEELEPIIEEFIKRVAKNTNPSLVIRGKDLLPRSGEYNLEKVISALEKIFEKKFGINFDGHKKKVERALKNLPPRKPVLCQGCPHRSTFYAVKKIFGDAIYAGDIGCYMMGAFEPFKMQDFIISMGGGMGLSHGITKVSNQDVVVFIGDSTFFHAGMPGLLNYKFNDKRAPLVVILDNGITAMTGHQPHPGSGFTGMDKKIEPVKIEEVAKALGAEVRVASAFNQKELLRVLKELKKIEGPRVLVSKGECRLLTVRRMRRKNIPVPKFQIKEEKFKNYDQLVKNFSCPAIVKIRKKGKVTYKIDPSLCWGCGVCRQIFPKGVIELAKSEKK
jgi:indolepyruvate ferredoxin oxidoreductase alpha subunit